MNCPSHTDETTEHEGWNQNPPAFAADLTTRSDLNGIANLRLQRDRLPMDETLLSGESKKEQGQMSDKPSGIATLATTPTPSEPLSSATTIVGGNVPINNEKERVRFMTTLNGGNGRQPRSQKARGTFRELCRILVKFSKFVGPGFMVSVAYIDPGNYSTDVGAGAATRFQLLFIVLLSNLIAIVLQALAVRLGTVTGLNLAENCRAHLPKWLNILLYIFAEAAIIATDIAEVIGSAIALNLLFHIPLVAGCAITLLDVLLILLLYSPNGSMRRVRAFELFVMALVLAVVVCFCIQLSFISNAAVGEVFRGYLPSSALVDGQGLYLSCGILGATVMPHSLYLGSGMVQPRLRAFDEQSELQLSESSVSLPPLEPDATRQVFSSPRDAQASAHDDGKALYRPSLAAIKSCLSYSVTELALSLSIFALFVNSAILIVAGASLSSDPSAANASLFGIHDLLSSSLAPAAGTIFALALLLSGTSAGIICTIAGQMVSEGAIDWTMAPWLRRLLTRSIAIVPSIIIAGAVGEEGLTAALNGSQVALSIILPFVSAPLIYFTCRNKYMTVGMSTPRVGTVELGTRENGVSMRNGWFTSIIAVLIWLLITTMNVALLVLLGMGNW